MAMKIASSFAHLLGLSAKAENEPDKDKDKDAKRAEKDDDKQRDDETDDEYSKRMKAKKKAEEEEKDEEAKRCDEDDGDEEMRGTGLQAQARKRERVRCAAIFSCPAAAARPDMAAHLAFNTSMKRSEAIGMLEASALGSDAPRSAPGRQSLDERMSRVQTPNAGPGSADVPAVSGAKGTAALIAAAAAKARGET